MAPFRTGWMLKKAVQRGRRRVITGGVPSGYVEDLNDARTKLAGFFSVLLRLFDRFVVQLPVSLCLESYCSLTFCKITRDGESSGISRLGGLDHLR